ncbi:MAG: BrnA antitoxin family protein [Acetobacteraceae bacterium]
MNASKRASRHYLKSDLSHVDAHAVKRSEYRELPELTEDMLARATVNRGGRPRLANPRRSISLRLPVHVIERWRATGPGWQTRMAERLSKGPMKTGSGRRDSVSARRA